MGNLSKNHVETETDDVRRILIRDRSGCDWKSSVAGDHSFS